MPFMLCSIGSRHIDQLLQPSNEMAKKDISVQWVGQCDRYDGNAIETAIMKEEKFKILKGLKKISLFSMCMGERSNESLADSVSCFEFFSTQPGLCFGILTNRPSNLQCWQRRCFEICFYALGASN